MFQSKSMSGTVLLALLATHMSVGTLTSRVPAQRQEATEPPATKAETKPANAVPQKKPASRLDLLGDPLPEGAIARLGTLRLYHRGPAGLSSVNCLLYSPDGKTLISGYGTEIIRSWDVESGKEVRQFVIPQERIPAGEWLIATSLALSRDGKTLAAGTLHGPIVQATGGWPLRQQGRFYLWDVASGKLQYQGEKGGRGLTFSPSGKVLASIGILGDEASQVRLWEVSTGKELRRFSVEGSAMIAFSPTSDTLAVVRRDSTIFIMDAANGKVLHKLSGHVNAITRIEFSRDGKTLASIEAGRAEQDPLFYVRIWNVESGKLLQRLGHRSWVEAIAFGADGMLAAAAEDGIHFWNSQSGNELRHSSEPVSTSLAFASLAFSPDGNVVAHGNGEGVISFWDVGTATQKRRISRHELGLHSVSISPDGRTLATASGDHSVGIWDVASARLLRRLTGHKFRVQSVTFSPSGKLLGTASFDDNDARSIDHVYLWDVVTGEIVQRLKGRCIAFSPDGKHFAHGGLDDEGPGSATIRLRDVETGKLIRLFYGHNEGAEHIAFSPDGKALASTSTDAIDFADSNERPEGFKLRFWDVASGRVRWQVDGPNFRPSILTFSSDGRSLVTVDRHSNEMQVWEVATGKKRRVLDLKTLRSVTSVLFMPDNRTLAVGTASHGELVFLDLVSGKELRRVPGHSGAVNGLALSRDGKALYSGSADTTALVWDLQSLLALLQPLKLSPEVFPGANPSSAIHKSSSSR